MSDERSSLDLLAQQKIFSSPTCFLFLPALRSLPTPIPDAVLSPCVQNSFQQGFIKFSPYFIQSVFILHKMYFYDRNFITQTVFPSHLPSCSCVSRPATNPLQSSGSPHSSGELKQILQLHVLVYCISSSQKYKMSD